MQAFFVHSLSKVTNTVLVFTVALDFNIDDQIRPLCNTPNKTLDINAGSMWSHPDYFKACPGTASYTSRQTSSPIPPLMRANPSISSASLRPLKMPWLSSYWYPGLSVLLMGVMSGCHCAMKVIAMMPVISLVLRL
jgi:hypothetical protein